MWLFQLWLLLFNIPLSKVSRSPFPMPMVFKAVLFKSATLYSLQDAPIKLDLTKLSSGWRRLAPPSRLIHMSQVMLRVCSCLHAYGLASACT